MFLLHTIFLFTQLHINGVFVCKNFWFYLIWCTKHSCEHQWFRDQASLWNILPSLISHEKKGDSKGCNSTFKGNVAWSELADHFLGKPAQSLEVPAYPACFPFIATFISETTNDSLAQSRLKNRLCWELFPSAFTWVSPQLPASVGALLRLSSLRFLWSLPGKHCAPRSVPDL